MYRMYSSEVLPESEVSGASDEDHSVCSSDSESCGDHDNEAAEPDAEGDVPVPHVAIECPNNFRSADITVASGGMVQDLDLEYGHDCE